MKIYTRLEFQWNGTTYIKTSEESREYSGPVAQMCGADPSQQQIEGQQQSFMTQVMSQAGQTFGADSAVFNSLMSTFAPTIAAGPNQQGFSRQELANLNSEVITQTGQSYKNAKAAVGNAQAASGGGNTALPSGAQLGINEQLASGAANQTAGELGQITQANYATGRQNYENATSGLLSATQAFNSSAGLDNAATGSSNAAASTANQIAQENNSWVQGVTGALGGIAGAAVSDFSPGGGTPYQSASGADPLGQNTGYTPPTWGMNTFGPGSGPAF